jgi:hypothetical protein
MNNPYAVQTVRCAGPNCEHVRKDCNHWFVIKHPTAKGVTSFQCEPLVEPKNLRPWNKPVCGQACAQKLFEKWMSDQVVPLMPSGEKEVK